jgi:uncharacterized protein YbaP (TraB family)
VPESETSESTVPARLIAARRAFERAQRAVTEIGRELPSGRAIAEGTAELSDQDRARWQRAWSELRAAADAVRTDPWWDTVASVAQARAELDRATREPGGETGDCLHSPP